jgi:hypothetical protein
MDLVLGTIAVAAVLAVYVAGLVTGWCPKVLVG